MPRKNVSLLCTLLFVFTLLAGCGGGATSSSSALQPSSQSVAAASSQAEESSAAPAAEGSVIVTDMMDREVTVPQPVEKIVALTAADCEILYAIGAGDAVVGRGEYCNWPEEVLEVPTVQSGSETNVEEILSLAPQVVFTSSMDQATGPIQQLEEAGIAVLVSEGTSIEGTYKSIEIVGQATGHEEEAAKVVADMKAGFEEIAAKVPAEGEKPKVYFEVSPLEYGLWTTGANTFMDEIATLLGMENIFADVEGWVEISEEQVLERDPDYIITVAMYFGEGPTPEEEIVGRAGWQDVAAVKNGKVFQADQDTLARPGPRLVEGAEALYNYVYA